MRRLFLLCLILLVFIVPIAATPVFSSLTFTGTLTVSQFNWGKSDGSYIMNSRVGEVRLIFSSQDIQTITSNGGVFINVGLGNNIVNGPQWIVQNMFVPSNNYILSNQPGAIFGIGDSSKNGTSWTNNFINVMMTTSPIDYGSIISSQTFNSIEVIHRGYRVGGRNGGGSGSTNLVNTIGYWKGLLTGWIPVGIGLIKLWGPIPAIKEGNNECAPSAVARSIKYMAGLNGVTVEDPQAMKDKLVKNMYTNLIDIGTFDNYMLSGKNLYTNGRLPINSNILYGMPIATVINTLNNGGDVEVLISWIDENGKVTGGHAAMVLAVIQHADGSYTIIYIDDANQGDEYADNSIHFLHVDKNGNFPGGKVDGFFIESWTSRVTPTRVNTPTPTPTPRRMTPTPTRRGVTPT